MRHINILDGSMGQYCIDKGIPQNNSIWSAYGLQHKQYHSIIIDAHKEYIKAGSNIITTNNYAVQPNYYRKNFIDWQERIIEDTKTAIELALIAKYETQFSIKSNIFIFGCLPPICETHRPDLTNKFIKKEGKEFCVNYYKIICNIFKNYNIDGLLAESMNNWNEVLLVIEACKDLNIPLIISMEGALRNNKLKPCAFTSYKIAEKIIDMKKQGILIDGFGFNCAPPEEIYTALQTLKLSNQLSILNELGIKLIAYANCNDRKIIHDNGFDISNINNTAIYMRSDLKDFGYIKWCKKFIDIGVDYCGGCCGCTPREIEKLSLLYNNTNY